MLLRENYTSEHILRLRDETGADPSILERTVFAFGLLEAIRSVDMPFIFKGGTSLLVMLDEPRRLSTDIDIIVERDTDVDGYIEKAADNEKKMTLFARANRLRFNNEFDKASGVYESIIAEFPEEAEAYWGLVLCKYGIEYVDDPATGKKSPPATGPALTA